MLYLEPIKSNFLRKEKSIKVPLDTFKKLPLYIFHLSMFLVNHERDQMVCTVQYSTVTVTVHFQRKTTQILPVERSFRSMENIFSVSSLLDCKNLYIITLNDQICEKQKTWKALINESLKLYKILSDIQGGGTMSLSIGDPRSVQFCLATRLQSISYIWTY